VVAIAQLDGAERAKVKRLTERHKGNGQQAQRGMNGLASLVLRVLRYCWMKAQVSLLAILVGPSMALAGFRDESLPEPPPTLADIHNHGIALQMMMVWTLIAMITLTWITWWGIRMIRRSHT